MSLKFQCIVADIHDPSDAEQPALEAAMALAHASGKARVLLFHNLYHKNFLEEDAPNDEMLAEARELLIADRRAKLTAIADKLSNGIRVEVQTLWSAEGGLELTRFAKEQSADLVVAVTQPRTRWQRLTLGNEDWQLIRYCPAPLLLVRAGSAKTYSHAMAAIDPLHADDKPASLDHRILDAAAVLCSLNQARLDVINVVPPVLAAAPSVAEPLVATDMAAQKAATQAHQNRVGELVKKHGLEGAHIEVMVGDPADQIVDYAASEQCDLLIMGAVSRSALGRLLIGNTAEKVLDSVDCDLFIVKSETDKNGAEQAA
ncbi:MAG: universal stress protein [Xanthomonadales bacterium]|nr:universal stress protein [Xanthomonadales bacterium]